MSNITLQIRMDPQSMDNIRDIMEHLGGGATRAAAIRYAAEQTAVFVRGEKAPRRKGPEKNEESA